MGLKKKSKLPAIIFKVFERTYFFFLQFGEVHKNQIKSNKK